MTVVALLGRKKSFSTVRAEDDSLAERESNEIFYPPPHPLIN